MLELGEKFERRTTADKVFDQIHSEISSLELLPGAKLSEIEIARRFGVSRQPVRDAFTRLANLDLLLVRPQRATEVRRFSMKRIAHARFVRMAVELEVVRCACGVWDEMRADQLDLNLAKQRKFVATGQTGKFHALDFAFHKMICDLGGHSLAFDTILDCKQKIDRLCVLSLGQNDEISRLLDAHEELATALAARHVEDATRITRRHLHRLDDTVTDIYNRHSEYFE